MVNYLKLDCFSLFRSKFVFVDTADFISANLLKDSGIFVKRVRVMKKKDSPYRLILCKIRKKDELNFIAALGKLRDMALIMGYQDYDCICEKLRMCKIMS